MLNKCKHIFRFFFLWRWDIGFINATPKDIIYSEEYTIHYARLSFGDRWFADPFILYYDDDIIVVLCEEMSDNRCKGRIAKLIFDRESFKLKTWRIILDLPTHLSFPRIKRDNVGNIYVHPENEESGCHTIYKYDELTETFSDAHVICTEPLVDAVMLDYNGLSYIFATKKNDDYNLYVYYLAEGNYVFSEIIHFNEKKARRAGDFFYCDNRLYSPAQNNNETYGGSVVIQEVFFKEGHWHFVPIKEVKSTHPIMKFGLHTFNYYDGMVVIDVKGFKYPKVVRSLKFIKKIVSLFQ